MAQGQQEVTKNLVARLPAPELRATEKLRTTYFLFREKKIGTPALINLKLQITDRQAPEVSTAGSKLFEVR